MATAKPAPYSNAITAGSDSSALARSALSLSKTGSPSPAGTPVATSSQTPPIESWSLRTSSISAIICAAAAGIGTAHRRRLDLFQRHRRRVGDVGDDGADLLDVAEDADALPGQEFLGDGPGGDPADGLAGAGPAAAAVVAQAVLGVEGEVGVAGPILVLDVAVIAAALVAVAEEDADRGAVGHALEDAGPDFRQVLFLALRDDLRLPRPAAAQVGQQVLDAERQTGRAAVDDDEVARAVADAGGGDAEQFAEGVAWHKGNSASV